MEPQTPLALRIVEVIGVRGEGDSAQYVHGSGCIVASGTVLTAAHVIAGAESVIVRDPNKRVYPATIDERFIGDPDGPGPDLALVTMTGLPLEAAPITLAFVDRLAAEGSAIRRCHAVGYPAFMKHPRIGRDIVEAWGTIPPLSRMASGFLSLNVNDAPRELPQSSVLLRDSEWSGMSGAPVLCEGALLGVVTEHAPREGRSAITVTPISAIEPDAAHPRWGAGVRDPQLWWTRLGTSGLAALIQLPRRSTRSEPAYYATVREVRSRTEHLRDRAAELDRILNFVTGPAHYMWVTGGAWAGKTSLLAEAVARLLERDSTDVISYFLSRREADADSNRFLAATVPQLEYILDESSSIPTPEQFRSLWGRATARAARLDRHLVLAVDGLDEDLMPAQSSSVAALLPTVLGSHGHVLVASRPHPELPYDLPVGHPLAETCPYELEAFAGSEELAGLARQELAVLKRGSDDLGADILGVLATVAAPLTVDDLAQLTAENGSPTPAHTRKVRRVVSEDAARSLQPVGGDGERYQFAHLSLLEYARADRDLYDERYLGRIVEWAAWWAAAGWPYNHPDGSGTPLFLLTDYPQALASAASASGREATEAAALMSDLGWIDAAIAAVGVDLVLASLRTAADGRESSLITEMLEVVELQADHLRVASATQQPGHATTQLGTTALYLGRSEFVERVGKRLAVLTGPQLEPVATTEAFVGLRHVFVGPGQHVATSVAVTTDSRVAYGTVDGSVRVWDPATPTDPGPSVHRHEGAVLAIVMTRDGSVISGGYDGAIYSTDLTSPGASRLVGQMHSPVLALAVMPHDLVVSCSSDGTIEMWDDVGASTLGHLEDAVASLAVTAEGLVISGGRDGAVRLWDPSNRGSPGRTLGRHSGWVQTVAVCGSGMVVSGGFDGKIRLWNPKARAESGLVVGTHNLSVQALEVTEEGYIVSGGVDGAIRLWKPGNRGLEPRELARLGGVVDVLSMSAGLLAVGTSGISLFRLLNFENGAG
jgi:Trypsin-like peptidase domain/WD domain, G-beta repeat